jgi:hypothetical protein
MQKKIVYELPIQALPETGYADYNGPWKLFLCDHDNFKRGDLVYWFDPEGKRSTFAFIEDFKVDSIGSDTPQFGFILKAGETTLEADITEVIKVIGVISEECAWLEDGEEMTDIIEVYNWAVPKDVPVNTESEYTNIPTWRVTNKTVDTDVIPGKFLVIEIYSEHCFHYH